MANKPNITQKPIALNWYDGINPESIKNATANDEFIRLPEPDEVGIHLIIASEPAPIKTKVGDAFIVDAMPFDIATGKTMPAKKLILPKSLMFNMASAFARKNNGEYRQPMTDTRWRVWSDNETGQKFYKCEMV